MGRPLAIFPPPSRLRRWLAAALILALSGCTADDDGLLVLTAASTAELMGEMASAFEARTGTAVRVSAAGSGALARQILAGADADLFMSANPQWLDVVDGEGRVKARTDLLGNQLVLVVPRGTTGIRALDDLRGAGRGHVAIAGERVPAGAYAEAALAHAGVLGPLIEQRRIARGEDVRLTLAYVEAGEAVAGVVYATDARASTAIEVVHTFAPDSHPPIRYPLARLSDDDHARAFFTFAQSAEARALAVRHGFSPLGDPGH
jgi:molybdate transport system substrate-binding protein